MPTATTKRLDCNTASVTKTIISNKQHIITTFKDHSPSARDSSYYMQGAPHDPIVPYKKKLNETTFACSYKSSYR
jgi:hypothetical protein